MTGTPPSPPVWVNGSLVAADAAAVSAFDHGVVTGDGAFETVLIHRGRPFALARHLARMVRTLTGLGLIPPDGDQVEEACQAVVEASGLAQGRLRITVTGGLGPLGSDRGEGPPTVVVAASALGPTEPTTAVAVVPWSRNERGALAGLKTTSYAENVIALAHAHRRGASEAVFPNTAGRLCEGTGSNVFLALEGRLVTPTLAAGCLAGVTRALVLEALASGDWPDAVEEDVPIEALRDAEEAFLTSTTRGVQPIARVDGRDLPACPGPFTEAAAAAYGAVLAAGREP
ncbi:MAG TPA: aminotransferase class IV [Acidimicrobiales bacterium]|nr:aminotransferase class IV [Acidimicrobiales bacterium]